MIDTSAAERLFSKHNNLGNGFNPADTSDVSHEILSVEDCCDGRWEVVYRRQNDSEVAILRDGSDVILVGDVHGAWAVRLSGAEAREVVR